MAAGSIIPFHWKEGSFKQYHGRCAFLNEENLCDIYSEAGPETCAVPARISQAYRRI